MSDIIPVCEDTQDQVYSLLIDGSLEELESKINDLKQVTEAKKYFYFFNKKVVTFDLICIAVVNSSFKKLKLLPISLFNKELYPICDLIRINEHIIEDSFEKYLYLIQNGYKDKFLDYQEQKSEYFVSNIYDFISESKKKIDQMNLFKDHFLNCCNGPNDSKETSFKYLVDNIDKIELIELQKVHDFLTMKEYKLSFIKYIIIHNIKNFELFKLFLYKSDFSQRDERISLQKEYNYGEQIIKWSDNFLNHNYLNELIKYSCSIDDETFEQIFNGYEYMLLINSLRENMKKIEYCHIEKP